MKWLLPLFLVGCAMVTTIKTTNEDTVLPPREEVRPLPGTRVVSATTSVNGTDVIIDVRSVQRCQVETTPLTHHTVRTVHAAQNQKMLVYEYLIGIPMIVAGAVTIHQAGQCTSTDMADNQGSSPGGCYAAGGAAIAVGALFLGGGIYDSIQLGDSVDDRGVMEGSTTSREINCDGEPLHDAMVTLHGQAPIHRPIEEGRIVLSVRDVPEEALPSRGFPARVVVDDGQNGSFDVALSDGDFTLLMNGMPPGPRCRNALATAHASGADDEKAIVEAAAHWARAPIACGALWTTAEEGERVAALAVLAKQRATLVGVAIRAHDLPKAARVLDADAAAVLQNDASLRADLEKYIEQLVAAVFSTKSRGAPELCPAAIVYRRIYGDTVLAGLRDDIAGRVAEAYDVDETSAKRLFDCR